MEDEISADLPGLEVIDLNGAIVTPGLIDQHIHVTGGGGEGGPLTRAPELNFSELVEGGITSFVGVSGTDSETRPIEALMAKVRALTKEGATGWMWTSNYRYPPTTVTGDVRKDLLTIPECLGVKIAMGDHRCSFPTTQEVLRVLSDCRVGGMICGHDSYLHVHLGDLPIAFPAFMECVKWECRLSIFVRHMSAVTLKFLLRQLHLPKPADTSISQPAAATTWVLQQMLL